MDKNRLHNILSIGETVAVEFKRCSGGIMPDTYETVCSFLNRFGGDIYLGVEDNGKVSGVPANAAVDIVKNFISMVSNHGVISPTTYLAPEILEYEGKTIIHIHVPPGSEVHKYKGVVFDRVDDADVKVTATGQIAQMYIRKQNIFTEKRVYPYVTDNDLRLDLMPRIRQRAANHWPGHPWKDMDDKELLVSAGLYGTDAVTGEKGYNLAAVMLLGRDGVIRSVVPAYRTDALLRKVNLDRYDDRLIVETNLIESCELLEGFARKHLWDKFYLEGMSRVSLRDAIAREMLVNSLIHREFTSSFIAQYVIEKDRMYTKNANRAAGCGVLTPDNFQPNPKNPIVASFFRNIGLADELGSGVRKLHYYGLRYSGQAPQLIEGDVFQIIVPLDDEYLSETGEWVGEVDSTDKNGEKVLERGLEVKKTKTVVKTVKKNRGMVLEKVLEKGFSDENDENVEGKVLEKVLEKEFLYKNGDKSGERGPEKISENQLVILRCIKQNQYITTQELSAIVNISERKVRENVSKLKAKGLIERVGADRGGHWRVIGDGQ